MTQTEVEQLRVDAAYHAASLAKIANHLASQEFRRSARLDAAHALTEQLCATAMAHFQILRQIEMAERETAT